MLLATALRNRHDRPFADLHDRRSEWRLRAQFHPMQAKLDPLRLSIYLGRQITYIIRGSLMAHYVAETDENGVVICVWVADAQAKSPRVFDRENHQTSMTSEAQFYGASRNEIFAWVNKNA